VRGRAIAFFKRACDLGTARTGNWPRANQTTTICGMRHLKFVPALSLVIASFFACGATPTPSQSLDASADTGGRSDTGAEDARREDAVAPVDAADAKGPDDAVAPVDAADAKAPDDAGPPVDAADARVWQSTGTLSFDGVDDVVNLAAAVGAASETAFSAELWFKTTAATGMLFEVYGGGADRSIYLDNGKLCFYVYTPAYSTVCTAVNKNDGAWHHVAGTLGAVAGQRLYVDGVEEGSAPAVIASAFGGDSGFRLGYGYIGPNGVLTYFAGTLDEVRVWSVERTAAEIAANRSTTVAVATAGLQGYWKLDETGAAAVAADATANGNMGTLTNFSFTPSPWGGPGPF
jgi:hypothetical protein